VTETMRDRLLIAVAVSATTTAITAMVALGAAWRVVRPATWVNIASLEHACHADAKTAECTVTNKTADAVKTCLRVRLESVATKERVSTISMCPGRLDAFESRSIQSPWPTPIAKVCPNGKGGIDFDACVLQIEAAGY
jgi:hypothetical protein